MYVCTFPLNLVFGRNEEVVSYPMNYPVRGFYLLCSGVVGETEIL